MINFPYRLSTALIGVAATITIVQPQVVMALTAEEISSIAKEITVLVRSAESSNSGSGVIIGKDNSTDTYYVLTAGHVVPDEVDYQVVTFDGQEYLVSNTQRFADTDLAILQFTSNQYYRVATLINYDLSTKFWSSRSNSEANTSPLINYDWFSKINTNTNNTIFISGYLNGNNSQPTHFFTPGFVFDSDVAAFNSQDPFELGYELLYTNITRSGLSGAPLLDTKGRVIGIHGRADGRSDVQLGYSLGIPINKILELAPKSIVDNLRIESTLTEQLNQAEIASIQSAFKNVEVTSAASSASDWLNRGNQLYRLGRYKDAIEAFDKAIQLQPNLYQAWYAKGLLLGMDRKYQEAIEALQKATQLKPDFHPAWFRLGWAQYRIGKYQEAIASSDKAIQIQPKLHQAWALRGDALNKLQRYEEGLVAYNKVLQLRPNYHISLVIRGEILSNLALKDETAESYDKALDQYLEALKSYDKAIAIRRDSYDSWANRGWVLNQVQGYSKPRWREKILAVLDSLQRCASSDEQKNIHAEVIRLQEYKDVPERENLLKESQEKHKEMFLKESVASLDEALKYQNDNARIWYQKGWALNQLQQYEKSLESFDKVVKLNPDDIQTWFWRGKVLANLKRYEDAVSAYDKVIKLKPSSFGDTWHNRGWVLSQLKKYEEAVESFDEHLKINPNANWTWYLRGNALSNLEKYEQAVESFDKSIKIDYNSAYVWLNRGVALYYLKKYDEAIASYEKALEIDPEYKLAKKNIQIARDTQKRETGNFIRRVLDVIPFIPVLF